ncbi:MAG: aminoglycoside phosphotransferase family protein [Phycisphaerales bacterium]|nr:aminoglycoside phosphotransferase family protein [Phycisphaerales bacterium]
MPDDDRLDIPASLVRQLVATQFPAWAGLGVRPVVPGGWDHRSFRLGDELLVRMPSAARYAAQVEKENRWLPRLAPHLPLPIPTPLARGMPDARYPWSWSVYRWIDGASLDRARVDDDVSLACTLGAFLAALHQIDTTGGPAAGPHNFFRGGPLSVYDEETRTAIDTLGPRVNGPAVTAVWRTALASSWDRTPVWVHGDVSVGNLLVRKGRLAAVIDFGSMGVGDPACDLTMAWTRFSGPARAVFRTALPFDEATWSRAAGWALWKAVITLAAEPDASSSRAHHADRVIQSLLAHRTRCGR